MSTFQIQKDGNKVILKGVLDEKADLSVLNGLQTGTVICFKEITRINSCGVREWVNLLKRHPGTQLTYTECPIIIVKQLNTVPDFLGTSQVESFFAPYFSEATEKEILLLLQSKEVIGEAPPVRNTDAGIPLKFDAIPKQYFRFLSRK